MDGAWLRKLVLRRRRGDDRTEEREFVSKSREAFGAGSCFATSSSKVVCSSTFWKRVSQAKKMFRQTAYVGQLPGVDLGHLKDSDSGANYQEGEDDRDDDSRRCLKALVENDRCE